MDKVRKVINKALNIFPYVYTSFVWGFPFETMDDFFESVMLMTEFAKLGARVQRPHLSPRAGSPLYKKYSKHVTYSNHLPMHFLEVPRQYLPENVEDIIKSHPSIFTPFYYYNHPGFEEKMNFMQRLESLGNNRWDIISGQINRVIEETIIESENQIKGGSVRL